MSTKLTTADAEVLTAVDTLLAQIQTEHGWITDLKRALEQSETRAARLLTSVEAAVHTLPPGERRGLYIRIHQMRHQAATRGRPVRDGRQGAMLHFIADRAEGRVTTGEVRVHLKTRGFKATPQYVSNQMSIWMREGMLTRESHGIYRIDAHNPTLRRVRLRMDREALLDEIRAGVEQIKDQAERRSGPRPISDWIVE